MTAEPIKGEVIAKGEPRDLAPAGEVQTPFQMLALAIDRGMAVETLDKLMAMHERVEATKARRAFDEAISLAKADIAPVAKNREGHNRARYADFSAIAKAVDPVLAKYGLSYRFRSDQADRVRVTCILSHKDGHSEETTLEGPADTSGNKNAIQAIGSTLTYLQRYTLVQMLGIAASDDDDGKAAGAGDVISDEQAEILRELVTETNTDINQFLTYARAECIPDILASRFDHLRRQLEGKRKKAPAQ